MTKIADQRHTVVTNSQSQPAWKAGLLVLLLAVVLGLAALFVFFPQSISGLSTYLNAIITDAGPWGWIVIVALMILHCFVPIPAEFVAIAAGVTYGIVLGSVLVWVGAMLGALLSFSLARWLGEAFIQRFLNADQRNSLEAWKAKQGIPTLLISRLIPLISFNLINYAAGLTQVPLRTFLWTTAVGIIPITVLSVFLGATMRNLPMQWVIGLSALGLALMVIVHFWHRCKKTK